MRLFASCNSSCPPWALVNLIGAVRPVGHDVALTAALVTGPSAVGDEPLALFTSSFYSLTSLVALVVLAPEAVETTISSFVPSFASS